MITNLKVHPSTDIGDTVATVTATIDNVLILRGIKIIREDGNLKVDRDTRPLFTTKELRRQFCTEVLSAYNAN